MWISVGTPAVEFLAGCASLTDRERQIAARLRMPQRRRSFAAGRWLVKRAAAGLLAGEEHAKPNVPLTERFEVLGEHVGETTSRPVLFLDGLPAGLPISITHTDDTVAAAITDAECGIGIDLVEVRGVSPGFQTMWMKKHERRQVKDSDDPGLTAAMNWSAREAVFKASESGDAFRPADWSVTLNADQSVCSYRGQIQAARFRFFRLANGLLLTVAAQSTNVPDVVFQSPDLSATAAHADIRVACENAESVTVQLLEQQS